ncbi:MAG: hypothetical protein F6K04_24385 [Leptolyngbya sp. SIO4C5]|nr:hypothetical protein [Leptolyngbya sp. SIO4C5]
MQDTLLWFVPIVVGLATLLGSPITPWFNLIAPLVLPAMRFSDVMQVA